MATRGPEPTVSDAKLTEIIENASQRWGRPFVTATEVAEEIGMSRQGVHRRLERLYQEGEIRKYKPGRGAIWWTDG